MIILFPVIDSDIICLVIYPLINLTTHSEGIGCAHRHVKWVISEQRETLALALMTVAMHLHVKNYCNVPSTPKGTI